MLTRGLALAAVVASLSGCTGQSCDGLGDLQSERDAARASYQAQLGDGSTEEQLARHDALHELERRAYELEQSCERG